MTTIIKEQYIICDQCKNKNPMIVDRDYSVIEYITWNVPKSWFWFKGREEKGFCSWECARIYGDNKYGVTDR